MPLVLLLVAFLLLHFPFTSAEEDSLIPTRFPPFDFAVLPEHKLLFCRIHKAGSTAINLLLPAIAPPPYPNHPSWTYYQASDYGLNATDMSRILQDSSWLKVVIYRDPLERFVSAYRSKCEDFDGDKTCENVFHRHRPTFAEAIRRLFLREEVSPDSHFLRQATTCNLRRTLPYFDERFILTPSTSHTTMLRIVEKAKIPMTQKLSRALDAIFPLAGPASSDHHNTHSSNHSTLLHYYNHDCYIKLMVHYYQEDYSLFELPYPVWAIDAIERVTLNECIEFIKSH